MENEGIISMEQVYESESDDKQQIGSQVNPYECAILNSFVLYNFHTESAEIEKWSILNTNTDYVQYIRKYHHQME